MNNEKIAKDLIKLAKEITAYKDVPPTATEMRTLGIIKQMILDIISKNQMLILSDNEKLSNASIKLKRMMVNLKDNSLFKDL